MNAVTGSTHTDIPADSVLIGKGVTKVDKLVAAAGNPDLKLRVFGEGGGCSGFSYGFTFDEITNNDDAMITKNAVSLFIDSMSHQFPMGTDIDYKNDLKG